MKKMSALLPIRATLLPAILAGCVSMPAHAGWLGTAADGLVSIYQDGNTEVYLPFHTYHLRSAYTPEKIRSFQENPPGFGIGRGRFDADGDWQGIYAMGFQDSHFKPEWMVGYGYKTFWRPDDDWRLGIGYTAFLMTRTDIAHYTPFPGILPVASVSYRRLSVETAYVPGGNGFGNIFFFWAKYDLGR